MGTDGRPLGSAVETTGRCPGGDLERVEVQRHREGAERTVDVLQKLQQQELIKVFDAAS